MPSFLAPSPGLFNHFQICVVSAQHSGMKTSKQIIRMSHFRHPVCALGSLVLTVAVCCAANTNSHSGFLFGVLSLLLKEIGFTSFLVISADISHGHRPRPGRKWIPQQQSVELHLLKRSKSCKNCKLITVETLIQNYFLFFSFQGDFLLHCGREMMFSTFSWQAEPSCDLCAVLIQTYGSIIAQ